MLTEQDVKLIKDRAYQKGRWEAIEELLASISVPLDKEAESQRYNKSLLVIRLQKLIADWKQHMTMEKKRVGL